MKLRHRAKGRKELTTESMNLTLEKTALKLQRLHRMKGITSDVEQLRKELIERRAIKSSNEKRMSEMP